MSLLWVWLAGDEKKLINRTSDKHRFTLLNTNKHGHTHTQANSLSNYLSRDFIVSSCWASKSGHLLKTGKSVSTLSLSLIGPEGIVSMYLDYKASP